MSITFTTGYEVPSRLDGLALGAYGGPVVESFSPAVRDFMAEVEKLPGGSRLISEIEAAGLLVREVRNVPPPPMRPDVSSPPSAEFFYPGEGVPAGGEEIAPVGPAPAKPLKFSAIGGIAGAIGGGLLFGRWGVVAGGVAGAVFWPKGGEGKGGGEGMQVAHRGPSEEEKVWMQAQGISLREEK